MKRIVYTRNDGGVSIIVPAYDDPISGYNSSVETEDEYIARVMEKSIPEDATNTHICDVDEISSDRTFRDAWEQPDGKLPVVDMVKALTIAEDNIRIAREPKFTELDTAYMRADEDDDTDKKSEIAGKKQILRDATEDVRLSNANTEAELKTAMLDIIDEIEAIT